jgi:D-3-phosphoglycerate dehydrogenase
MRAKGFNMKILAYDIVPDDYFVKENNIELINLNQLLQESDVISIHTPLTSESKNLIGPVQLEMMKPSAFLVNTARGGIVDEDALYDALKSGKIAGAAFDVLKDEPPQDRKLFELDNFIATPHMAAFTTEAISNMERMSAQNVIDVLDGNVPPYVVNTEVLK